MAAPNSRPVGGRGAGMIVISERCCPSYPKDQARAPINCTWNVSCSPAMAGRSVVNDQLNLFQQNSPSSLHLFSSIVTPLGRGSGGATGEPWLIQGPLP